MENIPFINKNILKEWFKCGYYIRNLRAKGIIETEVGVPQGGIISPVLTNMTLDGATEFIRNAIFTYINNNPSLKRNAKAFGLVRWRDNTKLIKLYRFADDINILTKTKKVATLALEALKEFLVPRGLTVSENKTIITDLSGGKAEFTFCGYSIIKRTYGKTYKWFIVPPEDSIKRLYKKIDETVKSDISMVEMFVKTSSILRGWCNYFYTANARRAFRKVNQWFWKKFYWAIWRKIKKKAGPRRRGRAKSKNIYKLIKNKYLGKVYYRKSKMENWFILRNATGNRNKRLIMFCPAIFTLVESQIGLFKPSLSSCYLPDYENIVKINIAHRGGLRGKILKKYHWKCANCEIDLLQSGIKMEYHHILPMKFKGDTDKLMYFM
jgi:hypothetical protein